MQAHLYIISESFQSNSAYSTFEIEKKVKRLAEDIRKINIYKESNRLFSNYETVYPVVFHSNFTVEDFLCRPLEVKRHIDRDVVNALQNIFRSVSNTSFTSQEVIDLLPLHDETICHGLIAFHQINDISEDVQLIYGIDSWLKFRRNFLGKYPKHATFIDECSKYYPNLFFHSRNNETVSSILDNFCLSIVKHLSFLNDIFFYYRNRAFHNESSKYQTFTSECNLEADAAPKDNNDAKEKLTFEFRDINGQSCLITCYPHLRLCRSDNYPGDTHHYQHRIYFHEGIASIQKRNILIGHIGEHL